MSKFNKDSSAPTETDKGVYIIMVDRKNLFARKRHKDAESAKTECKRIAKELKERVLIAQIVGVWDKREKTEVTEPTGVGETESK